MAAFPARIPDPRMIGWNRWAGLLIEQCRGLSGAPPDEDNWRHLAIAVMGSYPFNKIDCPNPMWFNDWREWGTHLILISGSAP